MALNKQEETFLRKRPMKRLTFTGVNDLYCHPWLGAYTIQQCIELEDLYSKATKPKPLPRLFEVSDELERHNEWCIEHHGCGLYSPS